MRTSIFTTCLIVISFFTYSQSSSLNSYINFVGDPIPITPWSVGTDGIYYNLNNVGIGTAIPTEKLQVEGNIRLSNDCGYLKKVKGIYLGWASSYGTQFNHGIFSTDGTSYSDDMTLNSYGNVRINFDSNSNGTNTFTIGHATTGLANTLFTLNESGNVGIGESSPSAKIHVNGSAYLN